jgi:hypothetical protein
MRFRFFFSGVLILVSITLYSQESGTCAEKLKSAQSFFGLGQVNQVSPLLKDCLKSGFKKEEELSAYKLLIQTYLLKDKIDQADSTMYAFLKGNPEYQTSSTDHASFVYLFNKFDVKPIIQIVFHIGSNIPFLTFIDAGTTSSEIHKPVYASNILNLFFAGEAKFRVTKKLDLGLEFGYSQLLYSRVENYLDFAKINYKETQKRFEIPVSVSYNLMNFGKFTAYGRLGLGVAINLSTIADVSTIMKDLNNPNDITGESLNRKDSRAPVDIFGQIGAGIKFKIPRGYVSAELRSNLGMNNQVVPGGDKVQVLEYNYFYAEDGFRLNALNFNIGYTYVFYKPLKRKE